MKIFMMKLQIILIAVIGGGGYALYVKKENAQPTYDLAAIDPMKPAVHVDSNDSFDILEANLNATQNKDKSAEDIAQDLLDQVHGDKPDSEMVIKARHSAAEMIESGNVDPYRRKVESDPLLKRVIGR